MKDSHKNPYFMWIYSYEMSKIGKYIWQKKRLVVAYDSKEEVEDREVREMDIHRILFDEAIVKLIVVWVHISVNILKNIKVDEVHGMSIITQDTIFLKKKKYELLLVLFGDAVFNAVVLLSPGCVSKSLSPM